MKFNDCSVAALADAIQRLRHQENLTPTLARQVKYDPIPTKPFC